MPRPAYTARSWLREMRLPRPERQAARAERAAERQIRRERDNEDSAARRAAATEAESRRQGGSYFGPY
jgi:hypothetical protein